MCGVRSVEDARYCHDCGASLGIEVFDLTRNEPEPPPSRPTETGFGQRILVTIGVVGLLSLAGFALFGGGGSDGSDESQDAAAPAVTPTERLTPTATPEDRAEPAEDVAAVQFVTGPATIAGSLQWERTDLGPSGWPMGLVEWDEQIFLFTARGSFDMFSPVSGGLQGWTSDDGSNWQSLGIVIDDAQTVQQVRPTPDYLLASGSNSEGQPTVWTSTDGVAWDATLLPIAKPLAPGLAMFTHAAGSNDDVTVVFGTIQTEFLPPGLDALPKLVQDYARRTGNVGFNGGPDSPIQVYGPLGITWFSATPEELGVSSEAEPPLSPPTLDLLVWSSPDGITWTESSIPGQHISSVTTNQDGELLATGFGPSGWAIWTSSDGVTWENDSSRRFFESTIGWGKALVAVGGSTPLPDISISLDGDNWEELGLAQLLAEDHDWYFNPIAAGDAGIALVVTGYDHNGDEPEYEPISVSNGVYTIAPAIDRRELTLTGPGVDIEIPVHTETVPDNVVVDFSQQTITFLDPDSQTALVIFRFDELEQAQREANGFFSMNESQLLLFSPDAQQWSIQPLPGGQFGQVAQLLVTDSSTIATIARFDELGPQTGGLPSVEIWAAAVP